jgi:hypothetical protein
MSQSVPLAITDLILSNVINLRENEPAKNNDIDNDQITIANFVKRSVLRLVDIG